MTIQEKALIILEELDKQYTVASYMNNFALRGIVEGLKKIKAEYEAGNHMNTQEKALIILEELDKQYTVASYMNNFALRGITTGLKKIEEKEKREHEATKETDAGTEKNNGGSRT